MRSWSQGRRARARLDLNEDGIVWLTPRGAAALGHVPASRSPMRSVIRFGACLFGGLVVSASLPGTAFAPIAQARASLESVRFAALPDVVVSVPVQPAVLATAAAPGSRPLEVGEEELDSYLRFGNREIPRPIVDTIVKAAEVTKVDPTYLMALADKESAFQPQVKASTSSARGLYQFIDRTWLDVVRRFGAAHGLATEAAAVYGDKDKPIVDDLALRARILEMRNDPYLSAVMAAEMLKADADEIGLKVGRTLTTTEMYLTHFLGLEDAARFIALREEKTPPAASEIFPAAARANVAIFYGPAIRTGGQRRGRWARPSLTIPQVYDRIQGMMDARLDRFGPIKTYAAAAE